MSEMTIDLKKGQRIEIGLSRVGVGLGWDPNEGDGFTFDLDVSAFLINKDRKLPSISYLVYYNSVNRILPERITKLEPFNSSIYPTYYDEKGNYISSKKHYRRKTKPISPDFSVIGAVDDMSGNQSDGEDDETINIDLSKVDSDIVEIVLVVSIYDFEVRGQNFGQIKNSYIRIYNEITGEPIVRYDLDEDFSIETAVEFGRLYRFNSEWKFEAMGFGYRGGLKHFVNKYR